MEYTLRTRSLTGARSPFTRRLYPFPQGELLLCRGDSTAYFAHAEEGVLIVDTATDEMRDLRPVRPPAVVQATCLDEDRALLATGSYGFVNVHRVGEHWELAPFGRLTTISADTVWVWLAGRRMAVAGRRAETVATSRSSTWRASSGSRP